MGSTSGTEHRRIESYELSQKFKWKLNSGKNCFLHLNILILDKLQFQHLFDIIIKTERVTKLKKLYLTMYMYTSVLRKKCIDWERARF